MHPYSQLPLQLLSVLALTAIAAKAQQPLTKSYCTTSFDTKSTNPVKSKTDYSTRTEKPTIYVTSTPGTTVTPLPSTETSIVATMTTITVTASQITDTFTDISTILTTTAIEAPTVTYTSVVTETTDTTVTSTSTVPTPAGFIPIQTSVGKAPAKKRDAALSSPNSGSLAARANAQRDNKNSGSGAKAVGQYPKKVECKVQVTVYAPAKTSVKTAKTTTTITLPALTNTITQTTTLEATSTSLLTPASTTISTQTTVVVSETTTPSATVTNTETATNTVYAPVATYYAQCQPENFIGTNGWVGSGSATESLISGINSAFECCAACAQQVGCEYSAYQDPSSGGFGCILLQNSQQTCTDVNQFALDQSVNRYIASNGCVNAKSI